jgi:hypothetical protein
VINPLPDPEGAEQAELRSEDDGMPVHPEKSADPATWAAKKIEREKSAAAGYPVHPVARALADIFNMLFGRTRALKTRTLVNMFAIGVGMIIVANLLDAGTRRRRSYVDRFTRHW